MAKPDWLAIRPVSTEKYTGIKNTINSLGLHTVCVEARCPNIAECWGGGTATFMVLGEKCTRGCTFCAVSKSAVGSFVDEMEPKKLAEAVRSWNLDYAVITSVCRDDLQDQGASHFARCVEEIKRVNPHTTVELLIPDFSGDEGLLRRITEAKPHVIGHNIETVRRLSSNVRDRRASYDQSLKVLRMVKEIDQSIYTKSAMMLGLGESKEEVTEAMKDLRSNKVDFLAIGQYLKPKGHHAEIVEYITPERFKELELEGIKLGFRYVAAGPFVRSSYKAGEFFAASSRQ